MFWLPGMPAGLTRRARVCFALLEADPTHLQACDALIALDEAAREEGLADAARLAEDGQFEEALAALKHVRDLAPTDPELPARWAAVLEAAECRLSAEAAAAEAAGDAEGAASHWLAVLRLDPKRRRAREELAWLNHLAAERWIRGGEEALAAGREEEALAAWQRALTLEH